MLNVSSAKEMYKGEMTLVGRAIRRTVGFVVLFLAHAFVVSSVAQVWPSQFEYVRSGLNWYTIETEHFKVHFHADSTGDGTSRSAQVTARIAEEIYEPITSLYEYEPDGKVSIVLIDYLDYSNGAAYFFDNKIDIWAPALESPLRGAHAWLRNVITHEFTHIVQLQKTMKGSRTRPFYYLQYLQYEEVRRPDVLYGYPEAIASYPVPILNNPAWLAEGTAQYQREGLSYDSWDSHRDMILRTQLLADEGYTLDEMGTFSSKNSLQREQVYNHGFAFTHFLANTYGEEVLRTVSEELSNLTTVNVKGAISDALDESADDVFTRWQTDLRSNYQQASADIRANLEDGTLVEGDGFTNLYPAYSPDGTRLAYISNKGLDYNLLSLYVRDLQTGEEQSYRLEGIEQEVGGITCTLGASLVGGVSGRISWTPDGQSIIYAKIEDNAYGRRFSDLYRFNLSEEKSERLTTDQRAAEPAVSPDGTTIVFVSQGDGTTNLHTLDLNAEDPNTSIRELTGYNDGTQVTDPAWSPDGTWVYFGKSHFGARGIYRITTEGGTPETVLDNDQVDERSPAFHPDGTLYFSADVNGIYNLYRMSNGSATPVTNVLGGAFLPSVNAAGSVAFSRFQHDGYKIAVLNNPVEQELYRYAPPSITQKPDVDGVSVAGLNQYDDRDLVALDDSILDRLAEEDQIELPLGGNGERTGELRDYGNTFTSFSVFPTLRIDRYASPRRSAVDADEGRLGRELSNTKVGFYATSREVLEGLSMLAGVLVAPASRPAESIADFFEPSRLNRLDRDLFLQLDYKKGLPMFSQRWSPQISLELYNLTRGVEDGLAIEESPCTACLPDTTYTDLSYSLFEVNAYARSKINNNLLLELGYRYSPYSVTAETFFSREYGQSIPASTDNYFKGRAVLLNAYFEMLTPGRSADVIPAGLRAQLGYEYSPSELLESYDVEDGRLIPVYDQFNFHRVSADIRYGRLLPGRFNGRAHGLTLRAKASSILGEEVDSFFNEYAGGLIGARGYPFYALGGNEMVWLQAAYTFPIFGELDTQLGFLYFDKLYGRVYVDGATAWSGGLSDIGPFRKDIGAELRLGLSSFYLFPTAFFVSGTYGLDEFDLMLEDGFLTPDGENFVRYGQELQVHFGALFDFDF